jgi:septum site-determining protein MinC
MNPSRRAVELKGSTFALSAVHIYRLDDTEIEGTLAPKVAAAPAMLQGAPVVVDLHAPQLEWSDDAAIDSILRQVRAAGLVPVALAAPERFAASVSAACGLPLVGQGRSAKRAERDIEPEPVAPPPAAVVSAPVETAPPPQVAAERGTMVVTQPIRSGQRVYARDADLVILNVVNPGAEVIADGSIHIYGALRGKAAAGALGSTSARIFVRDFRAELVSIAGIYKALEPGSGGLLGKSAQVLLQDAQLIIAPLG